MTAFKRVSLALAGALSLALSAPSGAQAPSPAQGFPNKAVDFITPVGAGGGTDIMSRLLAGKLSERWGQPVVVQNKIGGRGAIAGQAVVRSKPDGYTVYIAAAGNITISPYLGDMGFDPEKDLTAVSVLATAPYVVIVNPKVVTAASIRDFIAAAAKNPGQFTWGSSTFSSVDHLAGESFQMMTKTQLTHVPYKTGANALVDITAGRVSLGFLTIPTTLQYIKTGQLKALGVSDRKRSNLLPDVPTIAEAGVTGYEVLTWYGAWVPSKTPQAIVDKLATDIRAVIFEDGTRQKIVGMGFDPTAGTAAEAATFVKSEAARFSKIIAATGLKEKDDGR